MKQFMYQPFVNRLALSDSPILGDLGFGARPYARLRLSDSSWLRVKMNAQCCRDFEDCRKVRFPDQTGHSVHGKLITWSTSN